MLRFIDDELHLVAYTPTNPEADEALHPPSRGRLPEFPTIALVRDGETVQFADTEAEADAAENRELAPAARLPQHAVHAPDEARHAGRHDQRHPRRTRRVRRRITSNCCRPSPTRP